MATAVKKPTNTTSAKSIKPTSPDNVKKTVTLGKGMSKNEDNSKADVARRLYEILHDEPEDVIVKAFINGASLHPKILRPGLYNGKRLAPSW